MTRLCCILLLFLLACDGEQPLPVEEALVVAIPSATAKPAAADPERGRLLIEQNECHRCHDGTGLSPMPQSKSCVGCHRAILSGEFEAPAAALADWRKNIVHLRHVPSLEGVGALYRADWIEAFLLAPHDLRPNLPATMPRLPIDAVAARDIAAHLTHEREPITPFTAGDVERGRALFAAKQCGSCHAPMTTAPRRLEPAVLLAPDLRHARKRMRPEVVAAFIRDPGAHKPGALMAKTPLTGDEARDLAAFVLRAPLEEPPATVVPERLPVLERKVTYEEIEKRVFKKVCWHCHAQPDFARGDGGPGMSGGFGFAGRKLDLSSYASIAGGYLDDQGEMASAFRKAPSGDPMLVAVMLSRQQEEAGMTPKLRGMPLGLPAMTPEEIQLVESWIAQGRPQ